MTLSFEKPLGTLYIINIPNGLIFLLNLLKVRVLRLHFVTTPN